MLKRQKHGQAKNQAFFQGPPIVEPPSYKLPISLPYFKGFWWEWYRNGMGPIGGPTIRGPWHVPWKNSEPKNSKTR